MVDKIADDPGVSGKSASPSVPCIIVSPGFWIYR